MLTRQASRVSSLQVPAAAVQHEPPHISEDESPGESEDPKTKRQKKPGKTSTSLRPGMKKRVRGVRGKLTMFTEMPLDVLFEASTKSRSLACILIGVVVAQIFGHLQPWDILRLARTTKSFRDILMRCSSISIWKKALANTPGLPECPNELTEPQYVNLVYDKHCHVSLLLRIPATMYLM
jgi:hypothetical protein